jgi:hypothetical protein
MSLDVTRDAVAAFTGRGRGNGPSPAYIRLIVGGIAYEIGNRKPPSWHKLLPALAAIEARLAAIE